MAHTGVLEMGWAGERNAVWSFRSRFQQLVNRSKDVEEFVVQSLERIGEWVGARKVTVYVHDLNRGRTLINASVVRNGGGWRLEVDDSSFFYCRPASHRRSAPRFVLRSVFCFLMDLPARWSGTVRVEYPGITILSGVQEGRLRGLFSEFGQFLHVVLMKQELAWMERHLQEEEHVIQSLREFTANLSKELYCLSSVSTVLGQSYDVGEILSRVLETTLPLVKADLGVVFLPDTGQCLSFHVDGSRYQRSEDRWFKDYFQSKLSEFWSHPERLPLTTQTISNRSQLPANVRDHLSAQGIRSTAEFSLRSRSELFGLGILGFSDERSLIAGTRLFMITLNMIGLFLENISSMRDLERQVKLKSQEILEMERQQRLLYEQVGKRFSYPETEAPLPVKRILDELERSRKMVLLGELASGVAHQIRNPLNNLLAALHLIRNGGASKVEKEKLFDRLTERVETMNRMINEFIRYTRMPELNLTTESINQVLNSSLQSFRAWLDLAQVELVTSFDPDLPSTKIDLFLMDQVFHNILKNALEAMYSNGRLWVSTRRLQIGNGPQPRLEFAEILFQDSGPGIPPEEVDRVLNPFYSRKEDGLGLGLAIVEHVVRAHGGGVKIKSQPGQGTSVIVYLPIR